MKLQRMLTPETIDRVLRCQPGEQVVLTEADIEAARRALAHIDLGELREKCRRYNAGEIARIDDLNLTREQTLIAEANKWVRVKWLDEWTMLIPPDPELGRLR